jgi:hypothetical protein
MVSAIAKRRWPCAICDQDVAAAPHLNWLNDANDRTMQRRLILPLHKSRWDNPSQITIRVHETGLKSDPLPLPPQ